MRFDEIKRNFEFITWRMIMRQLRFLYAMLALLLVSGLTFAQYSGSYDVGGGAMDFASPQAAMTALAAGSMSGPVTLNVYSGTYTGEVTIPPITGMGAANPLVIQNAPGESPVVSNPATSGKVFYLYDPNSTGTMPGYVTIRGFEITNSCYAVYANGSSSAYVTDVTVDNCNMSTGTADGGYGDLVYFRYVDGGTVSNNTIIADGPNANGAIYFAYVNNVIAYNNFVAGQLRSANYDLVEVSYSSSTEWYYNTLYANQAIDAFYFSPSSTNLPSTLKNNIFYCVKDGGYGSAIYWNMFSANPTALVSDYNVFYGVGGGTSTACGIDGWNKTLSEWQTDTGLDANSFSFVPALTSSSSPYDLHLLAGVQTIADNNGTPLAGYTTDFDGDTRDATNPDIGADERVQASGDVLIAYNEESPAIACDGSSVHFSMAYLSFSGTAPSSPSLYVDGSFYTTMTDPGGNYTTGVTLYTDQVLAVGTHNHHMEVSGLRLPAVSGEYDGPSVLPTSGSFDIGGGNNDFAAVTDAFSFLKQCGMSGDVVLNVYDGIYSHSEENDMRISSTSTSTYYVAGLGTYNLTIQAAPGASPVIEGTGAEKGFYLDAASNVTIKGLTISTSTAPGIYVNGGFSSSCDNITISDNTLTWLDGSYNSGAIYLTATNGVTVENNTVIGNGIRCSSMYVYKTYGPLYIVNNSFSGAGMTSYYLVYHYGYSTGTGMEYWYNNTFYLDATASVPVFQYTSAYLNFELKNNIFVHTNGGPILKASNSTWACPTNSDYNLFWTTGNIGQNSTASVAYATLSAYQAACGQDAHSLDCDPDLVLSGGVVDPTLHINPTSCANGAGTPLASVTIDRDGEVRDGATPDIGCDEVGPVPPEALFIERGDHFCLHVFPGEETHVYWCCPYDGPPIFTWLPGCGYDLEGCSEECFPYFGTVNFVAQLDSVNDDCPDGGWWSARFWGNDGDGCVCVFFERQLSVELMEFSGIAGNGKNTLAWTTASETDNDYFGVYRSDNGTDFEKIGQLDGQGTISNSTHYEFTDRNVKNESTYYYRLGSVDLSGAFAWVGEIVELTPTAGEYMPTEYALFQNFPNPFNPTTTIGFDLVESGLVTLKVYNPLGQLVATLVNGNMNAGRHLVKFDANTLPSGMYLYRLESGDFSATHKMLLLK